jgi:hypothetical protein
MTGAVISPPAAFPPVFGQKRFHLLPGRVSDLSTPDHGGASRGRQFLNHAIPHGPLSIRYALDDQRDETRAH